MKHLRLLYVSLLLSIAITGCHRRRVQVLPAPPAQPPIISTMPPLPPLTLPRVVVEKPVPTPPVVPVETPTPSTKKKKTHTRHRQPHKQQTAPASPAPGNSETPGVKPLPATGSSPIGQLSGEDTNTSPKQIEQARQLIESTEARVKNLSKAQQQAHKDALAQVYSFLTQAKQALSMNDLIGAQTLANKANILVDELLK